MNSARVEPERDQRQWTRAGQRGPTAAAPGADAPVAVNPLAHQAAERGGGAAKSGHANARYKASVISGGNLRSLSSMPARVHFQRISWFWFAWNPPCCVAVIPILWKLPQGVAAGVSDPEIFDLVVARGLQAISQTSLSLPRLWPLDSSGRDDHRSLGFAQEVTR